MSAGLGSRYGGKVAFVTGGAGGIGRATALAFAREGANVFVVDLSGDGARETVRLIESGGGTARAAACDVSKPGDVRAALDEVVEAFGGLDVAFNNAGVEQEQVPLAEVEVADFDRLVGVDLRGVFLCMKYQLPLLLSRGGGAIVNTSSGAGVRPIRNQAIYCAAKFGVTSMSQAAALEYADKAIRVNVVAPGYVDTGMMDRFTGGTEEGRAKVASNAPVGRMATPEEIASAVLFLCSDEAKYIVGHALVVDGGQTAGLS